MNTAQQTPPCLETPHLLLRPWSPRDAGRLFDIVQEENIFRYFPRTAPPPRAWVDRYIDHHKKQWEEHGCGHWAVVSRFDEQVIGWTGLEYLPDLDEVEVAYLLSKQARGHGYATEAAQAALRFGFESLHLPAIIGLVHPGNAASIRVLEKCGLIYADTLNLWGMDLLRYRLQAAFRE